MNDEKNQDQLQSILEEMDVDDDFSLMSSSYESILLRMIKDQVKKRKVTLGSLPNLYEIIYQRFAYMQAKSEDNAELLNKIKERKKDVLNLFLTTISEELNIIVDPDQYEITINLESIVDHMYDFFILKSRDIFKIISEAYITDNYDSLIASYKIELNKKDLEYISLKKRTSYDNLVLINSMESIVKDAINYYSAYPDEIFKKVNSYEEENIVYSFIYDAFFNEKEPIPIFSIGETFSERFFSMLNEEDNMDLLVNNLKESYLSLIYSNNQKSKV